MPTHITYIERMHIRFPTIYKSQKSQFKQSNIASVRVYYIYYISMNISICAPDTFESCKHFCTYTQPPDFLSQFTINTFPFLPAAVKSVKGCADSFPSPSAHKGGN